MADPSPSPNSGAVFLSYAREDIVAARRIADALRAVSVEVWFDQNELVGGDAWDAKIRGQIGSCALFVPLISANTQARQEGYFRLEWKLAEDRSHLMAKGKPFIVPVSVDATTERGALVPDAFLTVQWTKLPGGETSPAFVARVQRLLGGPEVARAFQPVGLPDTGWKARATSEVGRRVPVAAWGAVAVLAVALIVALVWRRVPESTPIPAPNAGAGTRPPALSSSNGSTTEKPAPPISDKSIAVLPFVNRSDEKDSAYFADGIHEDILTNLALIRELHVKSRTSVEQYRGTKKPMRQIGEELGAAFILEGSVQRAGNMVHITGQLIYARTDEHRWAQNYDRELTATNIFAIQKELAHDIARELKTTLSPDETKLLERRPTENFAAYDLYLKERELSRGVDAPSATIRRETLLQAALELDPKFAVAWAELCQVHSYRYFFNQDHTPARMAKAKTAMDAAVRLAPESPDTIQAVGYYYYWGFRDYARAVEQFEKLVRLRPNDPDVDGSLGAIFRRQGRWAEAVASWRKLVQLDPGNRFMARNLAQVLEEGRRYDDAQRERRRLVSAQPDDLNVRFGIALSSYLVSGATGAMEKFLAGLSETQASSDEGIRIREQWAWISGNLSEFLRLDQTKPNLTPTGVTSGSTAAISAAIALAAQGNLAGARERLGDVAELKSQVENDPTNDVLWIRLAQTEALLGHTEEALRCARKAVELVPESLDAVVGPQGSATLAFVYAWTGEKERAIAEYARLLSVPSSGLNIYVMKRDPSYFPLRGDPKFEALLNDPKNNAPLF